MGTRLHPNIKLVLAVTAFVPAVLLRVACAQQSLPEFCEDDRVLILSPHPDDEAIATAGVIQRALKAGSTVKVVCYTNGENNEFSFIVYEKRITFRKAVFLYMGGVRARETMQAMNFLGVDNRNVNYLCYPDFGTMEILTKYWDAKTPFRSMLSRVNKVSDPQALSVGAQYTGESVLRDIKTVLMGFKPTKIFVSHPADTNRDHQSLYLFLNIALWDLAGQIQRPDIFPYLVHVVGWPVPRGNRPELQIRPPADLAALEWRQLILTKEEIEKKEKAIDFYKSQIAYNPPYLYTFARLNELFGDFPVIELDDPGKGPVEWKAADTALRAKNKEPFLEYAVSEGKLYIRVALRKKIDKRLGLYIHLLGYSREIDFAQMPKLGITVGFLGMKIKDRKSVVFINDAKLKFEGTNAIISIPLASLGNPEYILARVRRRLFRVPIDVLAWRILRINPDE